MLKVVFNYFFPKEDWCHCPCDGEHICAGKLYYCEKCDDAYCEVCVDKCGYFNKSDPFCTWCKN